MNHDALRAHLRLLERGLPRREHQQALQVIPQGGRVPRPMKERVRELLRTMSVDAVSQETGLHRRTIARIRDTSEQ